MRGLLPWLGGLGGIVVFAGGVWAIVRGIVGQTDATKANTAAITTLTAKMDDMVERVARLEGRRRK